jgi:hypothetical protein
VAVNQQMQRNMDTLQKVAMRNRGLYWEGEQAKSRAQEVLESLSPQLCVACGERPRISQRIQVCEVCYREIEQEIAAAVQDGYKADEGASDEPEN